MATVTSREGVAIHNETVGTQSRFTRAGQKITYELTVVQQPERARACGQGAKSSSDRRPIDPPPIIELRVSEGEDASRDITFMHNASLFLYATLENARPIAQGRLPSPTASHAPVLTGSPVTGINYLERPKAAGYFIFPDLSVRHEGKYRLSFTLYEDLKLPQDMDSDAPPTEPVSTQFYPRCEVKSKPFDVYSAKKFPGLMESTMLSRTVADQGCRVRIRRDVRVRRRESKQEKDWGDYPQPPKGVDPDARDADKKPADSDADPTDRPAALNAHPTQPAPASGAPGPPPGYPQAPYGFNMNQQAPPSGYAQSNGHEHGQPPPQPQLQPPYPSHAYPPAPYMPQQHAQYPMAQYPAYPQPYFPPHPQAGPQMVPPPAYGYPVHQQHYQQPMQGSYGPQQQYVEMRHDGQPFPGHYGVPGGHQGFATHTPVNAPYTTMEQQQQQQQPPPAPAPAPAPAAQVADRPLPPRKVSGASQDRPGTQKSPAATQQSIDAAQNAESSRFPAPHFKTKPQAGQGAKRTYGSTFSTQRSDVPMRSGARPSFANDVEEADGSEEDLQDWNDLQIQYRRADGSYTQLVRHRI